MPAEKCPGCRSASVVQTASILVERPIRIVRSHHTTRLFEAAMGLLFPGSVTARRPFEIKFIELRVAAGQRLTDRDLTKDYDLIHCVWEIERQPLNDVTIRSCPTPQPAPAIAGATRCQVVCVLQWP